MGRAAVLGVCASAMATAAAFAEDVRITDPETLELLGFGPDAELYAAPGIALDKSGASIAAALSPIDETLPIGHVGYVTLAAREFRATVDRNGAEGRYFQTRVGLALPPGGQDGVQAQFQGLPDGETITAFDIWWEEVLLFDRVRRMLISLYEVCEPDDGSQIQKLTILASFLGEGRELLPRNRFGSRSVNRVINNKDCYYYASGQIPQSDGSFSFKKVRLTYR